MNPEQRNKYLQRKYGITQEQYLQMFQEQEGACWICHREPKPGKRPLCVDHNHKTGEVRGLLCMRCNLGLGTRAFRDNISYLLKAAEYLKIHGSG